VHLTDGPGHEERCGRETRCSYQLPPVSTDQRHTWYTMMRLTHVSYLPWRHTLAIVRTVVTQKARPDCSALAMHTAARRTLQILQCKFYHNLDRTPSPLCVNESPGAGYTALGCEFRRTGILRACAGQRPRCSRQATRRETGVTLSSRCGKQLTTVDARSRLSCLRDVFDREAAAARPWRPEGREWSDVDEQIGIARPMSSLPQCTCSLCSIKPSKALSSHSSTNAVRNAWRPLHCSSQHRGTHIPRAVPSTPERSARLCPYVTRQAGEASSRALGRSCPLAANPLAWAPVAGS
jgi:hypothetical protein